MSPRLLRKVAHAVLTVALLPRGVAPLLREVARERLETGQPPVGLNAPVLPPMSSRT